MTSADSQSADRSAAERMSAPKQGVAGPDTRAPHIRDLTALVPLLIFDLLLGTWGKLHFQWVREWLTTNIVLAGVFLSIWKWLPDDYVKGTKVGVARLLESRTMTRALWAAVVAFVAVTGFVSTVDVEGSALTEPVTVYRVDSAVAAGATHSAGTGFADSARLDKVHTKRSFVVRITPMGTRHWFQLSPERVAPAVRVFPWMPYSLVFPDDFAPPVTAAALPAPAFAMVMRSPTGVRLLVRERDASGLVIADDTVRRFQSLLVSFTTPAPPDSAARLRWLLAASKSMSVDTSIVTPLVADWMKYRWIRTTRPLRMGERLGLVLIGAMGDTLVADTVTLTQRTSHVILRRS